MHNKNNLNNKCKKNNVIKCKKYDHKHSSSSDTFSSSSSSSSDTFSDSSSSSSCSDENIYFKVAATSAVTGPIVSGPQKVKNHDFLKFTSSNSTIDFIVYPGSAIVDAQVNTNIVPGITGPTGPIGATGPVGLQGPQGEPGLNGNNGINGQNGVPGSTGPQGEFGPTGPTGANAPDQGFSVQSTLSFTTTTSGTTNPIVFTTVNYNSGMYAAGTGIATIPATGKWLLTAEIQVDNSSTNLLTQAVLSYGPGLQLVCGYSDSGTLFIGNDDKFYTGASRVISLTSGTTFSANIQFNNTSSGITASTITMICTCQRLV